MKSRLLRGILSLLILASFTAAGYHSYRWYAAHQRKKALALYFRKNSPVTRRMPEDAILYLNLYNSRRLLDAIQNTRLSKVYAHWLDTGMGESNGTPNPLMGGMLEKTFLNVFGEEVGLAMAPGKQNGWDIVAVARLAPGSDFLLKLALSQNKKLERMENGDNVIYVVHTRNSSYPHLYLFLDSDTAYASSSLERLRASMGPEGKGPSFLAGLPDETLPDNTFLFVKGSAPSLSLLGFLEGKRLRLHAECSSVFEGPLPAEAGSSASILELLTNLPQAFHQPAGVYAFHSVDGAAVSTVLLAFDSEQSTQEYGKKVRALRSAELPNAPVDTFQVGESECSRFPYKKKTAMMCERGALLLLADDMLDPNPILDKSGVEASRQRPLTVQIKFNRESVKEFEALAERGDWSRFAECKTLYFLGCLRSLDGGVDETRNEIVAEIE